MGALPNLSVPLNNFLLMVCHVGIMIRIGAAPLSLQLTLRISVIHWNDTQ